MAIERKVELKAFDVAEHLRTPQEMAAYLDACIEESDGDSAFIAKALGDIARSRDEQGRTCGGPVAGEPVSRTVGRAQP